MAFNGQSSKSKNLKTNSFIESLRDLTVETGKTAVNDIFKQIPKDISRQAGLVPNQTDQGRTNEEFFGFEERREFNRKIGQLETVRHQEKTIFSAREKEVKTKITILYEEVKKLSKAHQAFTQEIQITTFQAPADPGEYHISFLEKLVSFVKTLTKSLEDATHWASAANKRSKKRSYYWRNVDDSGSKFLLSQERYMATQAG